MTAPELEALTDTLHTVEGFATQAANEMAYGVVFADRAALDQLEQTLSTICRSLKIVDTHLRVRRALLPSGSPCCTPDPAQPECHAVGCEAGR